MVISIKGEVLISSLTLLWDVVTRSDYLKSDYCARTDFKNSILVLVEWEDYLFISLEVEQSEIELFLMLFIHIPRVKHVLRDAIQTLFLFILTVGSFYLFNRIQCLFIEFEIVPPLLTGAGSWHLVEVTCRKKG